jgi:transcriptional regulator with XRE-family HTH domain
MSVVRFLQYRVSGEGKMDYRTRMRALREDNDLTQKQVGAILNKSQQGYSHIEDGRAELKIDDLITLCRFYGVSADYFIGLSNEK